MYDDDDPEEIREADANAERCVSCVNACDSAHLTNEALKDGVLERMVESLGRAYSMMAVVYPNDPITHELAGIFSEIQKEPTR